MQLSIFDIYKIGIGPSSSHTMGPMKAARRFLTEVENWQELDQVVVQLYGSLALTGKGHGIEQALLLGLLGEQPESVDSKSVTGKIAAIKADKVICLLGKKEIAFDSAKQIQYLRRKSLPLHPNGMLFIAKNKAGEVLYQNNFYSIGGGFIVREDEFGKSEESGAEEQAVPHPFRSGEQLVQHAKDSGLPISLIVYENELALRGQQEVDDYLSLIWQAMDRCIEQGLSTQGILPGPLKVKRRAPLLYKKLKHTKTLDDPLDVLDWVNLFALSVNEENAAGGKVVTAPTNGAAGILPAVIRYYLKFRAQDEKDQLDGVKSILLTAAGIGMLYKMNASISGAEVGCQGEVGVACSMAAAGLCEVLGGTPGQVENAAEIAMEHNLGLTCDPVGGLVQVPCIERNAMGAVKAINAARMALRGDGEHLVSLDKVIKTMRQTGKDMQKKYKETSKGGLAVNFVEC